MAVNTYFVLENGAPSIGPSFDENTLSVTKDVTRTVKSSGGDSTTIQGAIDLFENAYLGDDCLITVDAATYNEFLDFDTIFGLITIRGDTRNLAGLAYSHNMTIRSSATNSGSGTCTLNKSGGSQITVTGSGSNPNFGSDSWGNGDIVYIITNSGTVTENTIDSVSSNVLNFVSTVNDPGDHGGSIVLCPDRHIDKTTGSGSILDHSNPFLKIVLEGFWIESSVTDSDDDPKGMINATERAVVVLNNCVIKEDTTTGMYTAYLGRAELNTETTILEAGSFSARCLNRGILSASGFTSTFAGTNCLNVDRCSFANVEDANFIGDTNTLIRSQGASVIFGNGIECKSTDGTSSGVTASRMGYIECQSSTSRNNVTTGTGDGLQATIGGVIDCQSATIQRYNVGLDITKKSKSNIDSGTVEDTDTAIFSDRDSYINAESTSSNLSGNTTDYSPSSSDTVGNTDSIITHS